MIIKIILVILTLLSSLLAEISLSLGMPSIRMHQTGSGSLDLTIGTMQDFPAKPALFYELDSFDAHLWLPNDRVIYGIGVIAEIPYKDRVTYLRSFNIYPMYINYLMEITPNLYIGPGINWAIMDLRNKGYATNIAQLPGISLCIRKEFKESFVELDWLQMKAAANHDELNYYHSIVCLFRYGVYLEKN